MNRHPHPVVGFTAFAGSGKDEAASALIAEGFQHRYFAEALRKACIGLDQILLCRPDGTPIEVTDGTLIEGPVLVRRVEAYVLEFGYEAAKRHPEFRRAMQRTGTEGGRDVHGQDIWVDAVMKRLPDAPVVITDVRFPNEAAAVRAAGGKVVRIVRPGVGRVNDHVSEDYAESGDVDDTIVNDGSLEDLHEAARGLLQTHWW